MKNISWLENIKVKNGTNAATKHIVKLNRELATLKGCFRSQGQMKDAMTLVKNLDDSEMENFKLNKANLVLSTDNTKLREKVKKLTEENTELWDNRMRTQLRQKDKV